MAKTEEEYPDAIKNLMQQVSETQKRYQKQKKSRDAVRSSIASREFSQANSADAMTKRCDHLGIPLEKPKAGGTRSLGASQPTVPAAMRGTIESVSLERVLGKNNLMPVNYFLLGNERARSVGRITIRNRHGQRTGFGTGFLVSPNLLITNNHVLPDEAMAANSFVEFDFESDAQGVLRERIAFDLDVTAFFETNKPLDFSLVAVRPNQELSREPREFGWVRLMETDPTRLVVKGESVSIIQHPNGEAKQIAIRENQVVDILEKFLHYETDTAPGSSGSPVFNDQWELLALHHSGVPQLDADGNILAIDGRKWEPSMGDHRIRWTANEGVLCSSLLAHLKNLSLSGTKSQLRDELLNTDPPKLVSLVTRPAKESDLPNTAKVTAGSTDIQSTGSGSPQPIVQPNIQPTLGNAISASTNVPFSASNSVTWTIPLHVTINFGDANAIIDRVQKSPVGKATASDSPELVKALNEFAQAADRPYYDAVKDEADRIAYYQGINADSLSPEQLYQALNLLVSTTHINKPRYNPSAEVYPWVDLHPDLNLRSIYSGKTFTAEELIRADFEIAATRELRVRELIDREGAFDTVELSEKIDAIEAVMPFNCEHVVPQSWFGKREPSRGDVHHLFACETACNSFRGNIPFFDFPDFEETVRDNCGKREENKFEPSQGKGSVARATLYFMLRYPGAINDTEVEFRRERIETLLKWHAAHPAGAYELHRNQAIFQRQGNRNPLIDKPDWANRIAFVLGLG